MIITADDQEYDIPENSPIPVTAAGPGDIQDLPDDEDIRDSEEEGETVDIAGNPYNKARIAKAYEEAVSQEFLDNYQAQSLTGRYKTNGEYEVIYFPNMLDACLWYDDKGFASKSHHILKMGTDLDSEVLIAVYPF